MPHTVRIYNNLLHYNTGRVQECSLCLSCPLHI